MPKQSEDQHEVVERVMHGFKGGELQTGAGAKVISRKQAIAIALNEASQSSQKTSAENRRGLGSVEIQDSQIF